MMVATEQCIKALNDIYQRFMAMMLDGQEIFRNDEVVRKQFVFTDVLSRVSGPSQAGLRGVIKDGNTNQPIADARIALFKTDYFAISGYEGNYLLHCPSGDYEIEVTATGYRSSGLKPVTVTIGTISLRSEKLLPEVILEPA